jgi:hypothetical protein
MARYYFDIDDGEYFTRDDTGVECASLTMMRDHAITVLPHFASEKAIGHDRHHWMVLVRDTTECPVFRAVLSTGEWFDHQRNERPAGCTILTGPWVKRRPQADKDG